MEDLKLFDIEPIEPKKRMRELLIGWKRIKRNKADLKQSSLLLDQLRPEIKKVSLIVCKQPKTIKMVPCNWTKEQRESYIKSHYDENGKFIMQPAGDMDIFGGMATRS